MCKSAYVYSLVLGTSIGNGGIARPDWPLLRHPDPLTRAWRDQQPQLWQPAKAHLGQGTPERIKSLHPSSATLKAPLGAQNTIEHPSNHSVSVGQR